MQPYENLYSALRIVRDHAKNHADQQLHAYVNAVLCGAGAKEAEQFHLIDLPDIVDYDALIYGVSEVQQNEISTVVRRVQPKFSKCAE